MYFSWNRNYASQPPSGTCSRSVSSFVRFNSVNVRVCVAYSYVPTVVSHIAFVRLASLLMPTPDRSLIYRKPRGCIGFPHHILEGQMLFALPSVKEPHCCYRSRAFPHRIPLSVSGPSLSHCALIHPSVVQGSKLPKEAIIMAILSKIKIHHADITGQEIGCSTLQGSSPQMSK